MEEKNFKVDQLDLFVGNTVNLPNIECERIYTDAQVFVLGKNSHLYQSDKRLSSEINYVKEMIKEFFISNILVY